MSEHEGDLRTTPLPLVLQRIANDTGTGILTIQGEADIVAVSFLEGAVVAADALNQTVEDGLGKVLVRQDLIRAVDFQALAAEHQGGGGSLGDMLVRRGRLTREQLLDALRQQTSGLLLEVISWEDGEFKFYAGDEVSFEEGTKPLTVEEVLVGAIAAGDGDQPAGDAPDVHAVYRARPPRSPVRTIGHDEAGGDDVLWLAEDEMRLWRLADGVQTAHSVATGMDVHKVQYALHRLLTLELIEEAPVAQPLSHRVGAAEIFMPPDPNQVSRGQALGSDESRAWIRGAGWLVAVLLAIVLAAQLWSRPSSVLMPLPWHSSARQAYARLVQQSLFKKIERASQTFYLMEKRFQGSLIDLVDLALLSPRELTAPSGRPLAFAADATGYSLSVRDADSTNAGMTVGIRPEDWLLSEQVVEEETDEPALFLID